jgi:hypothetical protein
MKFIFWMIGIAIMGYAAWSNYQAGDWQATLIIVLSSISLALIFQIFGLMEEIDRKLHRILKNRNSWS